MTRAALATVAWLLAVGTVALAVVGGVALALPRSEPPVCEVLELDVLLHSIELVRVPGMDPAADSIPMTGALQRYARMNCNGLDVLVRADALRGAP